MKKSLTIIMMITFIIASCNTNQQEKEQIMSQKSNSQPGYPAIVDSLGVQNMYDNTKWHIYISVCADTPMLVNEKYLFTPPKPFGALDLQFDSLWQRNDSIAFYFDFYVNDTLSLHKIIMSMYPRDIKTDYSNGMMFYKGQDSLTFCYVSNHSSYPIVCIGPIPPKYYDTTSDKIFKPLQPSVIKYIQENKDQLNPWFRKEAEKRGIIK